MQKKENFYTRNDLKKIGFKRVGTNNYISKKTSFYSINGNIGSNVRIDDFVIIKGKINIGSNVHISSFCSLSGIGAEIILKDFSGLSNGVQIFTTSDNYLKAAIPGGTLNKSKRKKFSSFNKGKVNIGKCSIIGAGTVILPKVNIGNFVSIGSQNLISKNIKSGYFFSNFNIGPGIYRKRDVLKIKRELKKIKK